MKDLKSYETSAVLHEWQHNKHSPALTAHRPVAPEAHHRHVGEVLQATPPLKPQSYTTQIH